MSATMLRRASSVVAALVLGALLAGCERPPVEAVQRGYRGTGMLQVYNPRTVAQQIPLNQPPAILPAAPAEGPKASQVYKNVQVLGDLSVAEFNRTMASIAQWVAPAAESCNYCHNPANFAEDTKYTKVVARRMLQMTRHVNSDWKTHVAATGVTCYTCHRGNPVPQYVWTAPVPDRKANFIGDLAGQNIAAPSVGYASLPNDPFTSFLKEAAPIRVYGTTPLPTGNRSSIKQAEYTYGLMMHMSNALGVNCTYCHNTNAFGEWAGVPPQRVTAWYGIRMVRDLNNAYLEGLTSTMPKNRLGPTGDIAKVYCTTCHQHAYKPLYGAPMAQSFPGLHGPAMQTASLPEPLAEADHSVLYFGVGSSSLDGAQAKGLEKLIAALAAQPRSKVSISGYHSAAGDSAANEELAKQRASTVRDALLAAGIAETRVALAKPVLAEANLAGEDPAARRVEVRLK